MNLQPSSIEEVQMIVRQGKPLVPCGHGTKPALSNARPGMGILDMSALNGLLEYQPEEYTFTALAGTPISVVEAALSEKGQYLPFDPPLKRRGATLGGTVAAGLSGPGRFHHGGIRDFLLGVRFIDGMGRLVSGGGKVVKNAAGFDLPKLMVGSLGAFGIMVELTFKVLPSPSAFMTFILRCTDLDAALEKMRLASTSRLDLESLELVPQGDRLALWIRLSGLENTLAARIARLESIVGAGEIVSGATETALWDDAVEFDWATKDSSLVKLAATPGRIQALDRDLLELGGVRRYSAGGQVTWTSFEEFPLGLDELVGSHGLNGLVLWGPPVKPRLGVYKGLPFYRRIKSVLDPNRLFVEA